jgi:hypothetical protein
MSDDKLFERGEHGERHGAADGDNSPVEHQHLPEARKKDVKPPTVVFSFETEEQREELVAKLGIKVSRSTDQWVGWYPAPPDDGQESMF